MGKLTYDVGDQIKKTMVGKSYDITAGDSFKITCGKSSIELDKSGQITISGTWLYVQSTSQVTVFSDDVEIVREITNHVQITGDTDIN